MDTQMLQSGNPSALFDMILGGNEPPVSQVIVFDLLTGRPQVSVNTYRGGLAEVCTWGDDGQVLRAASLVGPRQILAAVAAARRAGQDHPGDFVTVNITRGSASLVA